MEFCPNCNAKMKPQKPSDESKSKSKIILACSSEICGYSETSKNVKVTEISDESKSIKVISKKTQKLQSMPTTNINCYKCSNDSAYFWEKQTSSLEEASTQFFRCVKCSYTWRAA